MNDKKTAEYLKKYSICLNCVDLAINKPAVGAMRCVAHIQIHYVKYSIEIFLLRGGRPGRSPLQQVNLRLYP